MSRFDQCIPVILANEGGFVDDPADPGGATNFGITQAVARANGYTGDMRTLPQSIAILIYKKCYWDSAHADQVPAPADLVVFDTAVNEGVGHAIKDLQTALGVAADGIFGPHSAQLAALANGPSLANTLLAERDAFYKADVRTNPRQKRFLAGWENRLTVLRKLCAA